MPAVAAVPEVDLLAGPVLSPKEQVAGPVLSPKEQAKFAASVAAAVEPTPVVETDAFAGLDAAVLAAEQVAKDIVNLDEFGQPKRARYSPDAAAAPAAVVNPLDLFDIGSVPAPAAPAVNPFDVEANYRR